MRSPTNDELNEKSAPLEAKKAANKVMHKIIDLWKKHGRITDKEYLACSYMMKFAVEHNDGRFHEVTTDEVFKQTGMSEAEFMASVDSMVFKGLLPESPLRKLEK